MGTFVDCSLKTGRQFQGMIANKVVIIWLY